MLLDTGIYKTSVRAKNAPFVYLASPYSHPDKDVRVQRFQTVCRVAGELMEAGVIVFCPIAHSHSVSEGINGRHIDHEFWMKQDIPMLARAERLMVLMIDGWKQSRGVAEEIYFAINRRLPIEYIEVT